MVRKFK